jgi:hypothetical protein
MGDVERRLKRVSFTIDVLPTLFTTNSHLPYYVNIMEGIPFGAKIIGAFIDHDRRVISLVLSHDSFDFVPEGKIIPELFITVERINKSNG